MRVGKCPYCANEKSEAKEVFVRSLNRYAWQVKCRKCLAVGPMRFLKQMAVEAWNEVSKVMMRHYT